LPAPRRLSLQSIRLGTELLDICFRKNGPNLSKGCIDALIAAGDVSQEYVDQQKKLLGR
jgi:hypothetical protein